MTNGSGRSVKPVLAVNFVGTLGFSIVLPFLVFVVTRLGGNALVYGVVGATYSFFQLIGAPILGRWSDRYGRRRILLVSQAGTLISWAIFLGALSMPVTPLVSVDSWFTGSFTLTAPLVVLFLARALDGATGGNVSVANAYLADITAESERSESFGRMAVAANLGFVMGPAIAGLLGAAGLSDVWPVAAALLISVVATGLIWFGLEDVAPCELDIDPERANVRTVLGQEQKQCFELSSESGREPGLRDVLRLPATGRLLVLQFLVFLAFNVFYVAFPVHAATALDWTLIDTGIFFSVMGLLMALAQGPVLGWASKRWSERRLVLWGGSLLALAFVLFVSGRTALIYSGTAAMALGNGVMWPSLQALLANSTGRSLQGVVQGLAGSAAATASILGLLLGGVLHGWLGAAVFGLSAVVTVGTVLLASGLQSHAPAAARAR